MRNKKTNILAVILLGILSIPTWVFSVSTSYAEDDGNSVSFVGLRKNRSAKILDDFKDKQETLLFTTTPFTSNEETGLFDADRKIAGLNEIIRRLDNAQDQYREQKMVISKEKVTLRNTLKDIDKNIAETESGITQVEATISEKNRAIAAYLEKISALQTKIDGNKKSILAYLSYIYSKGDLMYSDSSEIDVMKTILLNDGNLSDILSDLHYQSLLEQTGQNFIEIHRSLIKEYYYNTEVVKSEKIASARLKGELKSRRADLESQYAYKEQLLAITQGKEALFNRFIMEKQERENKLMASIDELSDQYDGTFQTIADRYGCRFAPLSQENGTGGIGELTDGPMKKCQELKQFYLSEKNLRDYPLDSTSGGSMFAWPVIPRYISAYYHDEAYFASVGSQHEAIDIPAAQGTDIVAPAAGYVYYINPPTPGGYGYMALKHSDGYITVYGHVSEVLVNKFDFVPAGKVFAKSGGAPGTPGAGVMTSGAHLHFEVHKDRKTIDPLRFFDLTYLRYESLDSKYKYKYIEDLRAKYGARANVPGTSTFLIKGDTEIDRQKYLLSTYAVGAFQNWDIWTEEAVSAKLDPSFLMCIGLAETGLGKNLKTSYNVGNIGNTDSGGTYEFGSARDGIYWMGKTLNNAYLRKYQSIDQLSRWGNKTGSIYASSTKNWHNNLVRCLSALKGRFIEDDYKFRLSPEEIAASDTGSPVQ